MIYSKGGMTFTEQFESCELETYLDEGEIPTIGWGHTGPEVYLGLTCTQHQADDWLLQDVQRAVATVNSVVHVLLNQHEFDALVDFTFNCGVSAFTGSTLLKLLNEGKYLDAAEQFARWDHVSGKVVAGLLRRRLAEKQEFLT